VARVLTVQSRVVTARNTTFGPRLPAARLVLVGAVVARVTAAAQQAATVAPVVVTVAVVVAETMSPQERAAMARKALLS
jgi:hypothetical protein